MSADRQCRARNARAQQRLHLCCKLVGRLAKLDTQMPEVHFQVCENHEKRVGQADHEGLTFVTLESNHANRPYGHNGRCRRSTLKNACRHAGDRLLILVQSAGNDEAVLAHDGTPCHTHFLVQVPQDFFHCAYPCPSRALSGGACPYKERRAFCLSFHCRDDEMQVNCREATHPDIWTPHCLHVEVQGPCVLPVVTAPRLPAAVFSGTIAMQDSTRPGFWSVPHCGSPEVERAEVKN